jgi:hypothetical protein
VIWPLFGATNQLLAGLALLVVAFYLRRTGRPYWFLLAPLVLMIVLPFWALVHQVFRDFIPKDKTVLTVVGLSIMALQVWMVAEALVLWRGAKGRRRPGRRTRARQRMSASSHLMTAMIPRARLSMVAFRPCSRSLALASCRSFATTTPPTKDFSALLSPSVRIA